MKIVEAFEQAVRDHEMRGAQHPDDHELIELKYKESKAALIRALKRLTRTEQMK